jgi:hypothetical protein
MEKKITKREMFEAIKAGCTTGNWTVDSTEVAEFCENEIALLDKKAAKAKERQAEKKAAGDELTDAVKAALTDEFTVIADIAAKVAETYGEDATVAKVTYRLGQLVKNGEAENTDVKVPGGEGVKARTIKGYRLLNA